MNHWLVPDWPQPAGVSALNTTRLGGVSLPPYDALNLGNHVGDNPRAVEENRRRLQAQGQLPSMPYWLQQVHGTRVLTLTGEPPQNLQADAVYTRTRGQVCAVMTADCLPVLFCSASGDEVAAAHAGWRGLCAGVLEATVAHFQASPANIFAWLGPAIGPAKFEVGEDVRQAFIAQDAAAAAAFTVKGDKYLADIYHLARQRLHRAGISMIYGGERCTVSESEIFFSYRRSGVTGRLASLIWLI